MYSTYSKNLNPKHRERTPVKGEVRVLVQPPTPLDNITSSDPGSLLLCHRDFFANSRVHFATDGVSDPSHLLVELPHLPPRVTACYDVAFVSSLYHPLSGRRTPVYRYWAGAARATRLFPRVPPVCVEGDIFHNCWRLQHPGGKKPFNSFFTALMYFVRCSFPWSLQSIPK